ncbi:MAG: hypothetical protein WC548_02840 [Candidatus Pacearchaeota archaeon]
MRLITNFLISIFFFSLVSSAPTLKFQHEDIQPGETILGTIEIENGNFTKEILLSDIKFLEGRKQIFIEAAIYFYDQKYFFYAYPTREGNFTLSINDILFKEEELKSINLEKKFEVKNINKTKILSIKPGTIFFGEEPSISFTNLGDSELNFSVKLDAKNSTKISLKPSESENFYFISNKNLTFIEIETYKNFLIPVMSEHNFKNISEEVYLKYNPELILKNLIIGEKTNQTIELFNFGDEEIKNIEIVSDLDFLKFSELNNISKKTVHNLTVFFQHKNPGSFKGNINISYSQFNKTNKISIPLSLFVLQNGSTEENFTISIKTCSEINGVVCSTSEICEGESSFTKGGEYCCLSQCKKVEENSSTSTWIYGILIFLLIGIVVYLLYAKSKKTRQKNPEEKIDEISKNYLKKFRVNRNLFLPLFFS